MLRRRTVRPPDGSVWHVGRRFAPSRPHWADDMRRESRRLRGMPAVRDPHFANLDGDNPPNPAAVLVLVLSGVVEAAELVVMLGVWTFYGPCYVLLRLLGRRPWTVTAHRVGTRRDREWTVTGWTASGRVIDELAGRLEQQRTLRPHDADRI